MNTKHTPGPWYYAQDLGAVVIYRRGAASPIPLADFGKIDIPETNANARLIAAAPDLVEAISKAIEIFRLVPVDTFTEKGKRKAHKALDGLSKALAKAKGE